MKKILIADDHNIVRSGVVHVLTLSIPYAAITAVASGSALLREIESGTWDLVITDISMPDSNGIAIVEKIRGINPAIPVLVFSMFPEQLYGVRAIKAGAAGYVCKEHADTELVMAVVKILSGKKYITSWLAEELALGITDNSKLFFIHALSDREFEIFNLLAEGLSIADIATKLLLSGSTVSTYRNRIRRKLQLKTNADIIRYAYQNKLL